MLSNIQLLVSPHHRFTIYLYEYSTLICRALPLSLERDGWSRALDLQWWWLAAIVIDALRGRHLLLLLLCSAPAHWLYGAIRFLEKCGVAMHNHYCSPLGLLPQATVKSIRILRLPAPRLCLRATSMVLSKSSQKANERLHLPLQWAPRILLLNWEISSSVTWHIIRNGKGYSFYYICDFASTRLSILQCCVYLCCCCAVRKGIII